MQNAITCPECQKRLGDGYLIRGDKVADFFYWSEEKKENFLFIPRGTKLILRKNWKQKIEYPKWKKKKPTNANWKTDHDLRMWGGDISPGCAAVYNGDNNRAETTTLCKLPVDVFRIEGPGAAAHEEEDRVRLLELNLKREKKLRQEAEAEAATQRDNLTAEKLKQRFDAIGLDGVKVYRPFHTDRAAGMKMDFDVAEIVLYNLEGLDDERFLKKMLAKLEEKTEDAAEESS